MHWRQASVRCANGCPVSERRAIPQCFRRRSFVVAMFFPLRGPICGDTQRTSSRSSGGMLLRRRFWGLRGSSALARKSNLRMARLMRSRSAWQGCHYRVNPRQVLNHDK